MDIKKGIGLGSVVDKTLEKYNVPTWLKPYIYDYVKSDPINAIKRATSFIEVRRKRGEVTREYVRLPNGMEFNIDFIQHVLSLFHYGEERIAAIYEKWSKEPTGYDYVQYANHFSQLAETTKKHVRAIRNLMEGMGIKPLEPTPEAVAVFDGLSAISDWKSRVLASGLLLKYTYGYPFGFIFYRVFYPASPEFMRSFGKAFKNDSNANTWLEEEAKRIVKEKELEDSAITELAENLLSKAYDSVGSELKIAKKAHVEREAQLLMDVSLAYPLHALYEQGLEIDIDSEIKKIKGLSRK
ncbi:hypothetical protein M1578_00775 [Candidatus Marsarchaeota archaeon]|nr:hypothetical protein [Candidatus Marsarchaeota archaeon]